VNMKKEARGAGYSTKPGTASEIDSRAAGVCFCEGRPLVDVLRSITLGGPEWTSRYVTLCFSGPANGWVLLYPFQGSEAPYFDFMYGTNEAPQQVLAAFFEKYPQCSVIDWSSGRLACLEAPGVDVESLANIIQEVASMVWGERSQFVDAWYEELHKA
ncbi:hypothetical protein, partial [Pseudomonas nitroreducens]|uniref:hypothetical protein n=2 Tax=Pseudomonas nitroreducens TaxID=46680 RepID=UPI001FB601AF